jgi:hypothetical protein
LGVEGVGLGVVVVGRSAAAAGVVEGVVVVVEDDVEDAAEVGRGRTMVGRRRRGNLTSDDDVRDVVAIVKPVREVESVSCECAFCE